MVDSKQKKIKTEVAHGSDAAEQKGMDDLKESGSSESKISSKETETAHGSDSAEQKVWDNPKEPEASGDKRNLEQLERQKKEAVRRKDNLTDNDKNIKN
ncbi:MAG: hypothetical protein JWN56_175 [Sphingobacteriales bacterium]|nr:hypothetical protein [Sphingobacteriales bacterium]